MTLQEMKQEQKAALDKAEGIVKVAENGNRGMTAAETEQYNAAMNSFRELGAAARAREEQNTLKAAIGPNGIPKWVHDPEAHLQTEPEHKSSPRHSTLRAAMKFATPHDVEQIKSFARYIGGDVTALADLTPSGDGGVFIPTFVAGVISRNYSAFTPVHDNCYVWPTLDGAPTKFPVISDSEDAVILAPAAATGADATVSGDTPPTDLDGPEMYAFKFSSKPVFVPRETITDSGIAVLEEVLNALISRILRTQNKKYTKGTGTSEPEGFIKNATVYHAGAVALDLDVALDLAYSVPQMYRPNGIYMASDTTIKYLRKLKTGLSGDKRALWKDVFEEGNATLGTPAKLHGYPIFVNNDMDSVAADGTFAGVNPLAFGDFKKFVVRDAEQGAPYVYRYAVPAKDGGAVIAFQRSDSKLIVPVAISKLAV